MNVEICNSDLNCCNAKVLAPTGTTLTREENWLLSAFGIIDYDHHYPLYKTHQSWVKLISRELSCDRAMWTCSTATWSMAARRPSWRTAPPCWSSPTMGLTAGRETGSGGDREDCSLLLTVFIRIVLDGGAYLQCPMGFMLDDFESANLSCT